MLRPCAMHLCSLLSRRCLWGILGVLSVLCWSSCHEQKNDGAPRQDAAFSDVLYFDHDGDRTPDYEEGGIKIEYNRNDLSHFEVSRSTATAYTRLQYRVAEGAVAHVRVTQSLFVDAEGKISYDAPASESVQELDLTSADACGSEFKKIGDDAYRAICQCVGEAR